MSIATLPRWIEPGLALIYPALCQLCETQRAGRESGFVCSRCWSKVRFIKPPFCERCGLPFEGEISTPFECSNCRDMELNFLAARSAVAAKGVARDAIHRYKYHQALWFETFLVDLLLRAALPELRAGKWDLIVPVPLHSTKQREREFNQAERLAAHLAKALTLPLNNNLISRVQPTRTQALLSKKQRAENVRRAFAARNGSKLSGERIILVDDVLTTGATTSACAGVLKSLGASDVCVWTVARGL
ncbi:MAG TPA: ComF family protein [Verrucomicrobiae bacterium]|nr:ComF family protein [Verrucomicrobiae bacterium]